MARDLAPTTVEDRPRPAPVTVHAGSRLRATCRVVGIERLADGALVRLVTVADGRHGPRPLRSGTPVVLRWAAPTVADASSRGGAIAAAWQRSGAPVDVDVRTTPTGIDYRLASGRQALRPAPAHR